MRHAAYLPVLAVLTACTVVPPEAWTFDPTRPVPREVLPAAEAAALTDRLAQLQLQRNEIRAAIAGEPDASRRQAHYIRLDQVTKELSPLERRLARVASAR